MDKAPELRRALFGYRKEDVETILDARERMFARVTEEAHERQEEADRLRGELEALQTDAKTALDEADDVRAQLSSQIGELRKDLDEARAALPPLEEQLRDAQTRADALESQSREAQARADKLELQSRETQARGDALEAQLADARREVADLTQRLRAAEETEAELRMQLEQAAAAAPTDGRELDEVVEATQDAIARIMASARRAAEEDLARIQQRRDEMQREIERVQMWRQRIEPITQDFTGGIAVAQAEVSQTAERVGEALRPMSDALTALSQRLAELARTADDAGSAEELRVDLVRHEQSNGGSQEPDYAPAREAPAGAPSNGESWPDAWR